MGIVRQDESTPAELTVGETVRHFARYYPRPRSPEEPERPRLSERETAVLGLVAEGCTNAEVGRRLYIGEST